MVGFIPPSAVQWFRGIVMSHIEYTANGVLMIVFGFLLNELRLQRWALILWFATLQVGTWTNGTRRARRRLHRLLLIADAHVEREIPTSQRPRSSGRQRSASGMRRDHHDGACAHRLRIAAIEKIAAQESNGQA